MFNAERCIARESDENEKVERKWASFIERNGAFSF